jgi:polyisoprenoid-binding protein YceI
MDEAKPEAASVKLEIDLLSIDTGSSEADTEVKRPLWFDVAKHPKAGFVSSTVRKLGDNRYEAAGKLTIKGKTSDAVVPFTTAAAPGGGLAAQGKLTIKRLDFGVGTGLWADTSEISNEVEVRFNIVLGPPKPAAK